MLLFSCSEINDSKDKENTISKPQLPLKKGRPAPYNGDLTSLANINERDSKLEVVFEGLKYPWAFEFLSDNEILVTEFSGKLKQINLASKQVIEISGLPELVSGKGQLGLMDIALHPDHSNNHFIYLSYAKGDLSNDKKQTMAVSRARLGDSSLQELTEIFVATPYGGSPSNFGGALEFDDKGHLFIGAGDRSKNKNAQKLNFLHGKIIRLNDDGSIPFDNPVFDSNKPSPIYAYGVRNPQGLVFDHISGNLYETEHGPMGGDEVNIIRQGENYGWPIITYGRNYTTQKIGEGTYRDGLKQPLYYYLPSIAVSPIAIYRGDMFPEWQGHLLVGALRGQHINKLDITSGAVKSEQRVLKKLKQRIRDIKISDDGSVYFLAQQEGKIYRLYQ